MSSLFPYPGGKSEIAPFIVERLAPHQTYVEPFAGSIAVLLAKPPSEVEVVSDLDGDIINFFQVLQQGARDNTVMETFQRICQLMPHARRLYETWMHDWNRGIRPEDPFERAIRWYYLQINSVNGKSGWIISIADNKARLWQNKVDNLPEFAKRLRHVSLENRDFRYIIQTYDRPETLFYIDPPYYGVEGAKEYYSGAPPFTEQDHLDLAQLLNKIQGKAIVSYYPDPWLDHLYSQGRWHRLIISVNKWCSTTHAGGEKQKGEELLLFSYEPNPLFRWQSHQVGEHPRFMSGAIN